jgi:hypothetical protein
MSYTRQRIYVSTLIDGARLNCVMYGPLSGSVNWYLLTLNIEGHIEDGIPESVFAKVLNLQKLFASKPFLEATPKERLSILSEYFGLGETKVIAHT